MKVSHVYYNSGESKFEYSETLVDINSVNASDFEHIKDIYFHASRSIDHYDYTTEIDYAKKMCEKFNHALKVYPYVQTEDSVVICKDCKLPFILTAREKDWYNAKQFSMPCRCKPCRDKRKQSRES